MPPKGTTKGIKTRHRSKESGAPASLPDIGGLYVHQDISADVRFHSEDLKEAVGRLAHRLEDQFLKVNPSIPLLQKSAVVQKIERSGLQEQQDDPQKT